MKDRRVKVFGVSFLWRDWPGPWLWFISRPPGVIIHFGLGKFTLAVYQ